MSLILNHLLLMLVPALNCGFDPRSKKRRSRCTIALPVVSCSGIPRRKSKVTPLFANVRDPNTNGQLAIRCGKALISVALAALFLFLYLYVANLQSGVNDDLQKNDQGAYMSFAVRAYQTNFSYTGGRNRMPLYPFIQALFYSPDLDEEAFFEQGKKLNVGLSILCLIILSVAFFAKFSKLFALYAILVIGFLVFAIKSPYFQAEILFYTLFGLAFVLSVETLNSPKWYKSLGVGLLFALAHLVKASVLPGLALFVGSWVLLILSRAPSRCISRAEMIRLSQHALVPFLTFTVILFPYLQESKERYGSYLYNVNTTFYIWYDSWEEAKAGTRAAGDRKGWPDLPDEEIPSLSKYLDEHSKEQVIDRFRSGAQRLINFSCYLRRSKHRFGYCSQVGLNLIIIAYSVALIASRGHLRHASRYFHLITFVVLFHVIYALSFAWYMPLIGNGPRTILSLMIPFLWTLGLLAHSATIESSRISILKWRFRASTVVYVAVMLTLLYEIYQVIDFRAYTMYGGE